MVGNYATGRRRFDCYASEQDALEAANRLARRLSEREVLAASMTNGQAGEYAAAVQALAPFKVSLPATTDTVAACLKLVGDLPSLHAAAKFYAARHRQVVRKRVGEVVAELLAVKEARGASRRYRQDLHSRLGRFGEAFQMDACDVSTAGVQAWLDAEKLGAQNYTNFRRTVFTLFQFAAARGYACDNPVAGVERLEARGGDVAVFTPSELVKLLGAASPEFLPCLAIGAFAGLRSAEIERLDWADVHLAERFIVVGAAQSKTASRRVVPIAENLAAWLAPYAACQGRVWPGQTDSLYRAQEATAQAAGVPWKVNALRHSYASYRFAETNDAGRVAGELGNSAAVVHRHYRELVKPAEAQRWFDIRPEAAANVVALAAAVNQ
jgi:site-specific recombinase XerC